VTKDTGSPAKQLAGFLAKFDPKVAGVARAAIRKLRARLRGAELLVYDNYNALAVGFGPSQRASEAIVSIAVYPRWASLFFLQGKNLDDPAKLLKGQGSKVRHIVLKRAADLDTPGVRALLKQALERAAVPLDPAHRGQLAIRAVAAKQRPRRP